MSDMPLVPINAKIPWVLANGAKRLAREKNMHLYEFLAELIAEKLAGKLDAVLGDIDTAQQMLTIERAEIIAAVEARAADA